MREVAVTEGDKVEAHIKFGWQIDHYGVEDIIREVEKVTEPETDDQMEQYAVILEECAMMARHGNLQSVHRRNGRLSLKSLTWAAKSRYGTLTLLQTSLNLFIFSTNNNQNLLIS